jgi:hypothetical protein
MKIVILLTLLVFILTRGNDNNEEGKKNSPTLNKDDKYKRKNNLMGQIKNKIKLDDFAKETTSIEKSIPKIKKFRGYQTSQQL